MSETSKYNLIILATDRGYKLLSGLPSDHGLTATAAHTFTLGDEEAVFWTVGAVLTGDQVRAIAADVLARWDDPPTTDKS